jgi:hypothetical protein
MQDIVIKLGDDIYVHAFTCVSCRKRTIVRSTIANPIYWKDISSKICQDCLQEAAFIA